MGAHGGRPVSEPNDQGGFDSPGQAPADRAVAGLRFAHLERQRDTAVRRITLALVRESADDQVHFYIRWAEASASGPLGRRGDARIADEREAHAQFEQLLHRHLARGYRETPVGAGFESWWLLGWGFRPEQIEPATALFRDALNETAKPELIDRLRGQGWRAYGHLIEAPLRRAFLVISPGEPRLLDPSLIEIEGLPASAFALAAAARAAGFDPLAIEVGIDADGELHPFDIHAARELRRDDLPRAERRLLLEQLVRAALPLPPRRASDPLLPVRPIPWSLSLRGGFWAVAPDETQAYWIS